MGNNVASGSDVNQLTQIYAIMTFIMLMKYIVTVFYAANTDDHPPEDAVLGTLPKPPENLKRRQRVLANDMENLPLHMIVLWAAYILQVSAASQSGSEAAVKCLDALVVIYITSRVLYSLCYIFQLQPWRTIFFTMALASIIAVGCHLIYNGFKVDYNQ